MIESIPLTCSSQKRSLSLTLSQSLWEWDSYTYWATSHWVIHSHTIHTVVKQSFIIHSITESAIADRLELSRLTSDWVLSHWLSDWLTEWWLVSRRVSLKSITHSQSTQTQSSKSNQWLIHWFTSVILNHSILIFIHCDCHFITITQLTKMQSRLIVVQIS